MYSCAVHFTAVLESFFMRALFQRRTQFHCCVTNKEQKKFLLGNKQERTNLQIGKKRFIKATKSKMVSPPVKKQLESTWSLPDIQYFEKRYTNKISFA